MSTEMLGDADREIAYDLLEAAALTRDEHKTARRLRPPR